MKAPIKTLLDCIVTELKDYELLALLHSLCKAKKLKDTPKPMDDIMLTCLLKAYVYFKTLDEIAKANKSLTVEGPDIKTVAGAMCALKHTDSDEAHDFVSRLAIFAHQPEDFEPIDGVEALTKMTLEKHLRIMDNAAREHVKASILAQDLNP